jgi:outer membrane protein TolC
VKRSPAFRPLLPLLCLAALGRPADSPAAELTFARALEVMRAANPGFQAARLEEAQRQQERAAARGLYYPRLTASGRFTRIDEPIAIDLDPIRAAILGLHPQVPSAAIPPFELLVQDDHFWRLSGQVFWPVFTGGRISSANQAADLRVAEARQQTRRTAAGLTTELVQRYFGVRLAGQAVAVRGQVLEGMDRHLFSARKLEANGMVPRVERLHAEVARAEAEREFKKAVRELEIARSALRNTLSSAEEAEPVSPLFLVRELAPLATFRQQALAGNPALRQLAAQRGLAAQQRRQEGADRFPAVYLFGHRELYQDDLTLLDPSWAAGVGFELTLFEGHGRHHRVQAARYLERRLEAAEQKARQELATLVERRYAEVLDAREQSASASASLAAAGEYLRARTRAFEEGMAASTEVVDARLMLARARIARLAAAYAFDVALAQLLEASGQSDSFAAYLERGDLEAVEPTAAE